MCFDENKKRKDEGPDMFPSEKGATFSGRVWFFFFAPKKTSILVKQLHAKMVIYTELNGSGEQLENRALYPAAVTH